MMINAQLDPTAAPEEGRAALGALWWSGPTAVLLLLMMAAYVVGPSAEPTQPKTSYAASGSGYRAAYLLLEQLHYPVERSLLPAGGAARLVLSPDEEAEEVPVLESWVRDGGRLLAGDLPEPFAKKLGLTLQVETLEPDPGEEAASGPGFARVEAGAKRVSWPGQTGRVWASAGGQPLVTVYPMGHGEIWLLNRPGIITNKLLRRADNAVFLCRLAEALLAERSGPLSFDEYAHGLRDRPGFISLLLRPPALAVTLQTLVFMAILLWHNVPRFGTLRPLPLARRRSKQEFLDAMANLLERKHDNADALATARRELAQRLADALGLPPSASPEVMAREAAARRAVDQDRLALILAESPGASVPNDAEFLSLLNELETFHDELFDRRHHR